MKLDKAVLFFCLCVGSFANAVSARAINKPLLYKVTKGVEQVYILGTIHFGFSINDLPKWTVDLHDSLKYHAYEMVSKRPYSILDHDNADHFRTLQNMLLNPEAAKEELAKITIKTTISEKVYNWILSLGIPPWYANLMNEDSFVLLAYQRYFLKETYKNLDHELILKSISTGKKLIELDTIELRNTAMFQPGATQMPTLSMMMDKGVTRQDLEDPISIRWFIYWYETGYLALLTIEPENPSIVYRNKEWLPRIIKLAKSRDAFIAVGVAHLGGKNGILQLMEDQGYKVERLLNSPQILKD